MKEITPFSLKDAPALIERLLPVQKLSAEAYKEQMANVGKMLTALGSYWKGRKPLILNKACILGCLLPATGDDRRDLEIFEKLMAMDDESFAARAKRRPKPRELLASLAVSRVSDFFESEPVDLLPQTSPIDFSDEVFEGVKVHWKAEVDLLDRLRLEAQMLPDSSYRGRVEASNRPEEVVGVHDHVWQAVNIHLGTEAQSFPELVEQLGIMRFGRRPRVADTFSGSGQIPFEAGRLGCDVYASDLNPIACLLTWGAFHIVGGSDVERQEQEAALGLLKSNVMAVLDELGTETDGQGWTIKSIVYCIEAVCPQSGWTVPLIPSLIISQDYRAVARLVPEPDQKRYKIEIQRNATDADLAAAKSGTVRTDGRGQDPYLIHEVNGTVYKTKISTLRGDYRRPDGTNANQLRFWTIGDISPAPADIFQERPYAIVWTRPRPNGKGSESQLRAVGPSDIEREQRVIEYLTKNLTEWQHKGWIPDMRIEPGAKTDEPIRTRGWTHWHHLFNPRQILVAGLVKRFSTASDLVALAQLLNYNSRLSIWHSAKGQGYGSISQVFYNQALNTIFNYGCRGAESAFEKICGRIKADPLPLGITLTVSCRSAAEVDIENDVYVTDPPYGDAVKYEEILEFFIAWLRRNPASEFGDWVWDSRRALAIKGEDEGFRQGMVSAYRRMAECMPDNGIQVIMFTHQSGSIWADMANIVWASGLHVTAAWYVVTETDNVLREGSYVKGTVLLVLRKRKGSHKISRDDLAWEIQEEVEEQVASLTGLNQQAKGLYRDENVFEDADIQMAGYAAALRVLTKYATIDGRDMTSEASRPRVKGEKTFIDSLIEFAVATANQCLVPAGIEKAHWDKLSGAERFYLKMLDLEARGAKTLDNYQNFAKAFKVRDFNAFLESSKANSARLKSASEFGRAEMGDSSEFYESVLRAALYAMMEIQKNIDGADVLAHLRLNVPNYYGDTTQRDLVVELAGYMAKQLETIRPDEASAARVLRELVKNERLG